MNTIANYINGNTSVTILEDGTKIREYEGIPSINHPESIDIKITGYCDMGCMYCHESSTTKGIHGDLDKLFEVISVLPAGVEIAIGGGNPLSHPKLIDFLQKIKSIGIIANLTVNQGHLKVFQDMITYLIKDDLVKGIGISITSNNFKYIEPILAITNNVVYHIIAGVNITNTVDKLIELGNCKILVLGYKTFGFGVNYYSEEVQLCLKEWYKNLPHFVGKCTLSFDNLAIEQLNVKRIFTTEGWDKFYMGDDFCYTMYIDAVKQNFAPTSRSSNRVSFNENTLINYFNTNNKLKNEIL
jgi:MoaA/NifB/PqqE/SkfB family radical SAM enzyme